MSEGTDKEGGPANTTEKRRLRLTRQVSLSDFRALLGIFALVITAVFSWHQWRAENRRQDADEIRTAVATCIAKLDRWKGAHLAMYDQMEKPYLEAAERVRAGAPQSDVRDFLLKAAVEQRTQAQAQIAAEQIEIAYADLVATHPTARAPFVGALAALRKTEGVVFSRLKEGLQRAALGPIAETNPHVTFYERVRVESDVARSILEREADAALQPFRLAFVDLLEKSDDELLEYEEIPMPEQAK